MTDNRFATALKSFLEDEFGDKVNVVKAVHRTEQAFEVFLGKELVHSKLTMGHGKCQTDEELDSIIDKIEKILPTLSQP